MLANLKIPGSYFEEISNLPPAVAPVATALPAFVGYTERATDARGNSLFRQLVKVADQQAFHDHFGRGPEPDVTAVTLNAALELTASDITIPYYLYDALRLFYRNGGGVCYVYSLGAYPDDGTVDAALITGADGALEQIAKVDEPTLLLFPDAAKLSAADLGIVQQAALRQCGDLKDRFTICDCRLDDPLGTNFRTNVGINNLKYGAAYTPHLSTRLDRGLRYGLLRDIQLTLPDGPLAATGFDDAALHGGNAEIAALLAQNETVADLDEEAATLLGHAFGDTPDDTALQGQLTDLHAGDGPDPTPVSTARDAFTTALADYLTFLGTTPTEQEVSARNHTLRQAFVAYRELAEAAYEPETNLRNVFLPYRNVVTGLERTPQPVPPSGAVAGVYARTDRELGVWRAPANKSIVGILGPTDRFTRDELSGLNVDAATGKSINAIRPFTGRGTQIYGDRTLTGNDGDNRYVETRRTLIFLEESIKKATEAFVFEPNNKSTWVRVKAMIENFLNVQWRAGALRGAVPAEAYRVVADLGASMTEDDVRSGRLIIDVALAINKPAEFIILRFSQSL